MDHDARVQRYTLLALREDEAAARAMTREGARLHQALAEMYRHEAAKKGSTRIALQMAFG